MNYQGVFQCVCTHELLEFSSQVTEWQSLCRAGRSEMMLKQRLQKERSYVFHNASHVQC